MDIGNGTAVLGIRPRLRVGHGGRLLSAAVLPALMLGTTSGVAFAQATAPKAPVVSPARGTFIQTMAALATTTKKGLYFETVEIPSDLVQMQQAMLDYGNVERRDPDFRKNTAKATVALDLTGSTVAMGAGKTEPIFKQSPAPPYFTDMKLNDTYNKAAQYFAEALAAGAGKVHTGPGAWTDKTGKTVNMTNPWDRTQYFGVPADAWIAEVAGQSGIPGDFPYIWMAGDTHFRLWFGVDGTYPEIGFGAAKDKNGVWNFVGIARKVSDGVK